jgi:hypothetical protein
MPLFMCSHELIRMQIVELIANQASFGIIRWADANGIRRKIVPHTFGGGLRGAAAQQVRRS